MSLTSIVKLSNVGIVGKALGALAHPAVQGAAAVVPAAIALKDYSDRKKEENGVPKVAVAPLAALGAIANIAGVAGAVAPLVTPKSKEPSADGMAPAGPTAKDASARMSELVGSNVEDGAARPAGNLSKRAPRGAPPARVPFKTAGIAGLERGLNMAGQAAVIAGTAIPAYQLYQDWRRSKQEDEIQRAQLGEAILRRSAASKISSLLPSSGVKTASLGASYVGDRLKDYGAGLYQAADAEAGSLMRPSVTFDPTRRNPFAPAL